MIGGWVTSFWAQPGAGVQAKRVVGKLETWKWGGLLHRSGLGYKCNTIGLKILDGDML